ncbi:purine-nucleoside phosphorylase [bacterium]|nr:purine-nucleoside phosphorylase [bacterium]
MLNDGSVKETADFLANKFGRPKIFFVLGSGVDLRSMTADCRNVKNISFGEIPNFPTPTVKGHNGKIVYGKFDGKIPLYLIFGRKHIYEGSVEEALFISKVMAEIGAQIGVFTSSMGAVSDNIEPGDLVLLKDIISLGGIWTAKYSQLCTVESKKFHPFDDKIGKMIISAGEKSGIYIKTGIAAFLTGPTYETLATVNMLGIAGADIVSMSMAPDVTAANSAGIRCVGVALVTNKSGAHSNHAEVLDSAKIASKKLATALDGFMRIL